MKYVLIISVFVGISSAKAHGVDGINLGPPSNDPKSLVKTMKADKDPALPRIAEGVTNGFKLWSAGSVVQASSMPAPPAGAILTPVQVADGGSAR